MSEKQIKSRKIIQEKAVKSTSISDSTSAIIEKLSQKSSAEPYDSLKGRFINISSKK